MSSFNRGDAAANAVTFSQNQRDAFDALQVNVDGKWNKFLADATDEVALEAVALLDGFIDPLTSCTTVYDVRQMSQTIRRGQVSPTIAELIRLAEMLEPGTLSELMYTFERLVSHELKVYGNGEVREPQRLIPLALTAAEPVVVPPAPVEPPVVTTPPIPTTTPPPAPVEPPVVTTPAPTPTRVSTLGTSPAPAPTPNPASAAPAATPGFIKRTSRAIRRAGAPDTTTPPPTS